MLAARSVVLILCFSFCATAQTRTLAVYPGPAKGLDSLSSHHLELELKRLLSPAGIDIAWRSARNKSAVLEEGPLVVGSFKGTCSVESIPVYAGSPVTRTLADTSVSNSRILPYFTVDCARLIRMLAPALQPLSVPVRASILGRAMGRLIAHEVYHILAQTPDHDETGLAKEQLSLEELTASRFELSPDSLRRMTSSWPVSPVVPDGSLAALAPARE
jgi:hypothetical protein